MEMLSPCNIEEGKCKEGEEEVKKRQMKHLSVKKQPKRLRFEPIDSAAARDIPRAYKYEQVIARECGIFPSGFHYDVGSTFSVCTYPFTESLHSTLDFHFLCTSDQPLQQQVPAFNIFCFREVLFLFTLFSLVLSQGTIPSIFYPITESLLFSVV